MEVVPRPQRPSMTTLSSTPFQQLVATSSQAFTHLQRHLNAASGSRRERRYIPYSPDEGELACP